MKALKSEPMEDFYRHYICRYEIILQIFTQKSFQKYDNYVENNRRAVKEMFQAERTFKKLTAEK
jgi:hypothetical protein